MKYCQYCGKPEYDDTLENCESCGAPFTAAAPAQVNYVTVPPRTQPAPDSPRRKGLIIVGFIVSMISLMFLFVVFAGTSEAFTGYFSRTDRESLITSGVYAIMLGIIGFILSLVGKKYAGKLRAMSIIGFIVGLVSAGLSLILLIASFTVA